MSNTNIYSDDFTIKRAYNLLDSLKNKDNNNTFSGLKKPEIKTENRKTHILNFRELCSRLNRTESEVQLFLNGELNCKTSIDQNGILLIYNMYRSNVIQSNIENYINTFVLCGQCKSKDTIIKKEKSFTYIECKNCKSKKCI
jgi:translation initiation factor 2 subunit 2